MRTDDAFWAARLVSRFSNDAIRAIVGKAQYGEPGAADHITTTLIKRRDKVLRSWLTAINPLVDARLDASGVLTFENVAVASGVATPKAAYTFTWSAFDNIAGSTTGRQEETRATEPRTTAPSAILEGARFVRVAVRSAHPDHPAWDAPVTFTFRRTDNGWQAVGIDRMLAAGVIR